MRRNNHTIDKQGKVGERKLTEFLVRNGQALLPMMELRHSPTFCRRRSTGQSGTGKARQRHSHDPAI